MEYKNLVITTFHGGIQSEHCFSPAKMKHIRVYNGKGSGKVSQEMFVTALNRAVDEGYYSVKLISPDEIKSGSWTKDTSLIAFGGGFDKGFMESLGLHGMEMIRDFVLNGGSYLGMCAGAYFACDRIAFDKGGPYEVTEERVLKFFKGAGIGPVFSGFDYNSRRGMHAVPLRFKDQIIDTYYEGGGFFQPDDNPARNAEVVGTYCSLENHPAAVVYCSVGDGQAVLSGVHLEFPVDCLDRSKTEINRNIPKLEHSEEGRKNIFMHLLNRLGVRTKCHASSLSGKL